MEGGSVEAFRLGNIGNYLEVEDFYPMGMASILGVNMAVAAARLGNVGGISLNTYFDTFGLEGILANTAMIIIIMQIARFAYTYGSAKPWSPFVFVCILLVVQLIHDIIFYYGAVNVLPSGKNEMIDALKEYAAEHGKSALGGHAILLIVVAVMAMVFKEVSILIRMTIVASIFYAMPFIVAFVKPRTIVVVAPVPEDKTKEPEYKEAKLTARDMYQDMNWR